jgi:hypothetical protein
MTAAENRSMRIVFTSFFLSMFLISVLAHGLQVSSHDGLPTLANFQFNDPNSLSIDREAIPSRPFTVVGPRGAILGWQDGTYEAWIFPWKIFSNRITAEMKDYAVPIDVNKCAAEVEVHAGYTAITFSHANFTVREILFAPNMAPEGTGVLAFYQIEAVRPMTLTFHFTPEMKLMWPAPSDDRPSPEWVTLQGGFYILHLNFPQHAAAIAMPRATPGTLPPYQERPQTYPLEFVLHFDPASDSNKLFPLLSVTADGAPSKTTAAALGEKLRVLEDSFVNLFQGNRTYYHNLGEHLSIKTPDKKFDQAFSWADSQSNNFGCKFPLVRKLRWSLASTPPEIRRGRVSDGFSGATLCGRCTR